MQKGEPGINLVTPYKCAKNTCVCGLERTI